MTKELDRLVSAVRKSAKYRHVSRDVIASIGAQELEKRPRLKEAVKATKRKLHQVGGAYLKGRVDYDAWLSDLRRAARPGQDALRRACARAMARHASTQERLAILDTFYTTILGHLPPPRSVLDVACGLNPLAIPWMGLPDGALYYAYDIYQDMVAFLQSFLDLVPVHAQVTACDVLQMSAMPHVDLALVLKSIPCLEQIDKTAGTRLLAAIDAEYVVLSYPVQSLGGHNKGMLTHYEAQCRELIAEVWAADEVAVQKFVFKTELAFLIQRASNL